MRPRMTFTYEELRDQVRNLGIEITAVRRRHTAGELPLVRAEDRDNAITALNQITTAAEELEAARIAFEANADETALADTYNAVAQRVNNHVSTYFSYFGINNVTNRLPENVVIEEEQELADIAPRPPVVNAARIVPADRDPLGALQPNEDLAPDEEDADEDLAPDEEGVDEDLVPDEEGVDEDLVPDEEGEDLGDDAPPVPPRRRAGPPVPPRPAPRGVAPDPVDELAEREASVVASKEQRKVLDSFKKRITEQEQLIELYLNRLEDASKRSATEFTKLREYLEGAESILNRLRPLIGVALAEYNRKVEENVFIPNEDLAYYAKVTSLGRQFNKLETEVDSFYHDPKSRLLGPNASFDRDVNTVGYYTQKAELIHGVGGAAVTENQINDKLREFGIDLANPAAQVNPAPGIIRGAMLKATAKFDGINQVRVNVNSYNFDDGTAAVIANVERNINGNLVTQSYFKGDFSGSKFAFNGGVKILPSDILSSWAAATVKSRLAISTEQPLTLEGFNPAQTEALMLYCRLKTIDCVNETGHFIEISNNKVRAFEARLEKISSSMSTKIDNLSAESTIKLHSKMNQIVQPSPELKTRVARKEAEAHPPRPNPLHREEEAPAPEEPRPRGPGGRGH